MGGCGGTCEPCAQIQCSSGTELVGADGKGCGGTCVLKGPAQTSNGRQLGGTGDNCDNSYVCPANSFRKQNRKCYDTFDDCDCKFGYEKKGDRCVSTCDNTYVCPASSVRKQNRKCYDSFDDCDCKSGYRKSGNRCEPEPVEPCIQILCSKNFVLVGADERGCGGTCEPCAQIFCSFGPQLVGDKNGCGGSCEPCAQIQCSSGTELVGADGNGCGGRCIKPLR